MRLIQISALCSGGDLTAARPSVRIPTFPTRGLGWPLAHKLCWSYISYCADIEGEPKINRPD